MVNAICEQSLDPEKFEWWEKIKEELSKVRKGPDEIDQSLDTLQGFDGTDFRPTGDEIKPLHQRGTIGWFRLGVMMPALPAFIHARHQYSGCWKYDLNFAVQFTDGWHVTRIYNVEEKYIHPQP